MAKIKAIETVYNGYKFRSRLEARWAVFFDAAGIKYEYEPQGFEMDDGTRYLPDFYLPDLDIYVEVKGDRPGVKEDIERYAKMLTWGGPIKALVILSDIPGPCVDGGLPHFPVLYYSVINQGVTSGWYFFHDAGLGSISKSDYPFPYRFDDDLAIIEEPWCFPFSVKSVSDRILKDYHKPDVLLQNAKEGLEIMAKYNGYKSSKEMLIAIQMNGNSEIFAAFEKARQARFEHGEQPVI